MISNSGLTSNNDHDNGIYITQQLNLAPKDVSDNAM